MRTASGGFQVWEKTKPAPSKIPAASAGPSQPRASRFISFAW